MRRATERGAMRSRAALGATVVAVGVTLGFGGARAAGGGGAGGGRARGSTPSAAPGASDDDGLRVQASLGTIDGDAVDRALDGKRSDVDACFTRAAAQQRWLGGPLEMRVRVRSDGRVKAVSPAAPLGSIAVERCVADALRDLELPSPSGAGEAEFTYTWSFSAAAPLREWGPSDVREPFEKNRRALDACARRGGVPRGLRVALFVVPGGRVGSVGVGGDGVIDDKLATCVAGKVATWRFNDPLGRVARATYQLR